MEVIEPPPADGTTPPPPAKVVPFDRPPYRVLPEMVIRHLLGQIDKVEGIMVMFRTRGEPGINVNYSSEISMADMCIMATSLAQMAQARMSYSYGDFAQPPNPDAPESA